MAEHECAAQSSRACVILHARASIRGPQKHGGQYRNTVADRTHATWTRTDRSIVASKHLRLQGYCSAFAPQFAIISFERPKLKREYNWRRRTANEGGVLVCVPKQCVRTMADLEVRHVVSQAVTLQHAGVDRHLNKIEYDLPATTACRACRRGAILAATTSILLLWISANPSLTRSGRTGGHSLRAQICLLNICCVCSHDTIGSRQYEAGISGGHPRGGCCGHWPGLCPGGWRSSCRSAQALNPCVHNAVSSANSIQLQCLSCDTLLIEF